MYSLNSNPSKNLSSDSRCFDVNDAMRIDFPEGVSFFIRFGHTKLSGEVIQSSSLDAMASSDPAVINPQINNVIFGKLKYIGKRIMRYFCSRRKLGLGVYSEDA